MDANTLDILPTQSLRPSNLIASPCTLTFMVEPQEESIGLCSQNFEGVMPGMSLGTCTPNLKSCSKVTSSAPAEPLKWSHGRCWHLSFRVFAAAAAAAAAVICLTECFRVRAHMKWLTASRNWSRLCAPLSNHESHDLMGLTCNMLDLFFERRTLRPLYGCKQSTPAFSVAPQSWP